MTALRCGKPDGVPYLDLEVAGRVVDAVLGRQGSPACGQLAPADHVEFARRAGMDAVYVILNWTLGRVYQVTSAGERQSVDGSIKTRDQLAGIAPPDITTVLRRMDVLCPAAAKAGLGVILGCITPYKIVKAAVGYQDFLMKTAEEQDFLVEFRDTVTPMIAGALERLLAYPVDALCVPGDLCFNSGPMLSPAFIRDYWLDNTRRFVDPARRKGLPVILHMDGDFSSILDMMLDAGADAIHPFEVTGGLDIVREKARLRGRAAVMGGVDCAGCLTRGTPEDVRRETRRLLDALAPGGGYVCGSSHEIGPDTPVENFSALVETVMEWRG